VVQLLLYWFDVHSFNEVTSKSCLWLLLLEYDVRIGGLALYAWTILLKSNGNDHTESLEVDVGKIQYGLDDVKHV